jgi:hypothetical protein
VPRRLKTPGLLNGDEAFGDEWTCRMMGFIHDERLDQVRCGACCMGQASTHPADCSMTGAMLLC